MPVSTSLKTTLMCGIIHRVDLVNRELELIVSTRRVKVDVPTKCLVMLRGEPVKLRILQPGDLINVAFYSRSDARVAREIEVQGIESISVAPDEPPCGNNGASAGK